MSAARDGHVVVVGGGLAGLSAAIRLVDGGARVSLFEGRPRFGGATWSFERNGLTFDNGQHVYLRCCTEYRGFLDRLATADLAPLQSRLSIPVLSPNEQKSEPDTYWIKRDPLPAPLHLARSLLFYGHLSIRDRLNALRAMRALDKLDLDDPALDEITFGQFLARTNQSEQAIRALFDLIILPTVNVSVAEASLALGAKVFKTGLLENASAGDLGWARVPLRDLHVSPAIGVLEAAGAKVFSKARVDAIEFGPDASASGVTVDGEHIEADAVVLAVPHEQAAQLLPSGGATDPTVLGGLGASPIIDVHLVFDRKVTEYGLAAGLNSPVQFVFDRTDASGLGQGTGQCLAISVSGADAEHGERPEVLIERYTDAVRALFPLAREANVVDAVVSREHDATFRGGPRTAALRANTDSGFTGLFLAGAWTDTGWPATMEGAVRSGNAAARYAFRYLDHGLRTEGAAA